ncbi:hypothetical protein CBR_g8533 [Chara braunii]|uniref:Uncharacterized protein n=1 Tax=Chara braunii TaxID=69332 RepID=A0A388KMG0_CHABU|nr:hypothetical protein CBR_g8533 [Chara braunii]|eukprot:GBG71231.1 hypothetical protein CBR_g8533 [Chara braunii]
MICCHYVLRGLYSAAGVSSLHSTTGCEPAATPYVSACGVRPDDVEFYSHSPQKGNSFVCSASRRSLLCLSFATVDPVVSCVQHRIAQRVLFERTDGGMSFILEFAEALIRQGMEDPEERDKKFREHIYEMKDKCEKTKEQWRQPVKPFGYWNLDKNNHKFLLDLKLSSLSGRRGTYDQFDQSGSS